MTGVTEITGTADCLKEIDGVACVSSLIGLVVLDWCHRNHRDSFKEIQLRGMRRDFTWDKAAEMYERAIIDAKFDDYRG